MLVLAARQLVISTALATRSRPLTCPPVQVGTWRPEWLTGQRLVYACCHGLPGGDMLFGDGGLPMVAADQIRESAIPEALVYLAGCYGIGALSDAFLAAGAAAVVGDTDVNWSGPLFPSGSNRLGQIWLTQLRLGLGAGHALARAKELYGARYRGVRDAELLRTVTIVGDQGATLWD